MIPIIDTHQHMWDLKEFSLPWLEGVDQLNKSYSMGDYVIASEKSGISQTIYMEVDVEPSQRSKEVDYVSELIGSQFKITNPQSKSSCGCGVSFSL